MYCIPKKRQIRYEKKLVCVADEIYVGLVTSAKLPTDSTNYWKCVSKICFHPDGQINKGFFNRPIMARTQILGAWNKDFDTVLQTH